MEPYDIFGSGTAPEVQPLGMDYTQMTQQQPDLSAALKPVANDEDRNGRRSMWSQIITKFQTDPNLQRAIGLAGAMMMQPIRPGQTTMGQLGNAAVVGTNAYQMGQQADFERGLKLKAEGRAESQEARQERQLAMQEGREPLTREALRTQTEGAKQTQRLTSLQIDDAILKAKEHRDAAPLRKMLQDVQQQEAEVKLLVGKEPRLQAELDRLKEAGTKLRLTEQQLRESQVGTRLKGAQAGIAEQEEALGAEGRAALKSKTSETVPDAQLRIHKAIYQGSDELKRQYPNEADYLNDILTGRKRPSAGENYGKLLAIFGGDPSMVPESEREVFELARQAAMKELGFKPTQLQPTQAHVEALRKNPERKADFEQKFGPGSAEKALAGAPAAGEAEAGGPPAAAPAPRPPAPSTRAQPAARRSHYGPATSMEGLAEGAKAGDQGAINYAKQVVMGASGNNLPEDLLELLSGDEDQKVAARAKYLLQLKRAK